MNQQIYQEAADWLVEFRAGRPDGAIRKRFDEWLSASPEHVRAYLECAAVSETVAASPRADSPEIEALIARAREASDEKVVFIGSAHSARDSRLQEAGRPVRPRRLARRSRQIGFGIMAVALLVVVGLSADFFASRNVYVTATGEQRSILLSDGSTIHLNARSRIRVNLDNRIRSIDLMEGEALFSVARDETRPFIVSTNGTHVRAVGTQFDVNRREHGVVVTVVEGTVAVSRAPVPPRLSSARSGGRPADAVEAAAGNGRAVTLDDRWRSTGREVGAAGGDEVLVDAGQQLTLSLATTSAGDMLPRPRLVDVSAATAWTQRRLVFDSTPLEDVVAEFNRNSNRELVIRGEGLNDFHVSGAFSSTDVQPFLHFLHAQPGVQVIESNDRIVIVHR